MLILSFIDYFEEHCDDTPISHSGHESTDCMYFYQSAAYPLGNMLGRKIHFNITGHSGFMGYGDLWGFITQNSFILNPCLDLWGFMGDLEVI